MRISGGEKAVAVLGYLPLVSLILWMFKVKRGSMFAQFHVRQSAMLFLLWLVTSIVMVILIAAIEATTALFFGLLFLATGFYGVMMIIGVIKSAIGERYRMPIVADVALKFGL